MEYTFKALASSEFLVIRRASFGDENVEGNDIRKPATLSISKCFSSVKYKKMVSQCLKGSPYPKYDLIFEEPTRDSRSQILCSWAYHNNNLTS